MRSADAADRIALLLARQIQRALDAVPETERVAVGVEVAQRLLESLDARLPNSESTLEWPLAPGEMLNHIGEYRPDGTVRHAGLPRIPLLDTTLLTNSPGEPRVGHQILTEIESADRIDLVMAFIRVTGLNPILGALRQYCARGGKLRVLTTTYTGSTEGRALELLTELGADVRVSYDLSTTRLHAKAWLFHRRSAFSTAYVGSSNLTHSAQVAGMEWNVRVSGARNPDVLRKIEAVFESYWESVDFVPYVKAEFDEALERMQRPEERVAAVLSPIEIRLEPFQERMLELIELSRQRGHHRNLLVSATGTGKTVMAAVDYGRLRERLHRSRLLFVAHQKQILDQSRATFRHALRDHAFGEMWVGGERPSRFDHVFASVQSLSVNGLPHLDPDHFDVVIIDEFHHAAAPSYRMLVETLTPRELLGLTATPERADGRELLHWFGDRIAAELRLWDAIEQHRLAPFAYYGIHDGTDLSKVPWQRGKGYDEEALAEVYIGNESWVRFVFQQLQQHVTNVAAMRCLGFCVTVAHARYMAEQFRALGINAIALWGDTPQVERDAAIRRLKDGDLQVIFSVELFNEGLDVPKVDTLLMLRPTESATLFLQQLGRGLRTAKDKSVCTVLDFVGLHRQEFRFDLRYRALLGGSRRDLERAVEEGFPFLPAGCHMELDRVARDIVLRSVREAIPSRWPAKVAELRSLAQTRPEVSLATYLHETGLELADVYTSGDRGWSALREEAGLPVAAAGPHERALRRGIARMQHVDDRQRVEAYRALLDRVNRPDVGQLNTVEQRLARMLVANLGDQVIAKDASLQSAVELMWEHPQVRAELRELLEVLGDEPRHMQHQALPDIPLQVHSQYTRIEILAAVGEGVNAKTPQWREGVYDAKSAGVDLLAFTLDKTSGGFSPTTRYRDYAINRELIHWESQSTTASDSPTGRRYRTHAAMGRTILLFARPSVDERAFWFLGPATYVTHEGDRPMAVTWQLETPLSGDLFAMFAAAVA
ncbi:DUF3427 domain-containing protein [Dactylosporangium vinaceum]|nr:DUF3427 domain-containing protein [Dactylosporangium vinaceum]